MTPSLPWLAVRGLAKMHADSQPLFAALEFSVAQGQTFAVIGSSGCGKTTLLRVLAGLATADRGEILINGRDVTALEPRHRHALYLYQEPLLFPHLDVFENIAFGLRLQRRSEAAIRAEVEAMLAELELEGYGHRHPDSLSGGQRQRVSFGRALVVKPALLLLDEPFSNLDPDTRNSMQNLFKRVAAHHRITAVFVTHDLKETLIVGDGFGRLAGGVLRCYPDRAAFCADPATGVQREHNFWQEMKPC